MRRITGPLILLAGVFCFHAWGTVAWLSRNSLPDGLHNEFMHLWRAVELFFRIRDMGGTGAHSLLFEDYYPPLFPLVADLFLAVAPNHEDSLAAANLVWLVLLLAAVFALGNRLAGPWTGALAAALVTLYPSIYGTMRHLEPCVALTACSAAAIWALWAAKGFSRAVPSALFGLAVAGGLLVDRLAMAPLMAAPAVAAAVVGWRRAGAGDRRRILIGCGLAAGVVVVLTAYYHGHFVAIHLAEISSQVEGEIDAYGVHTENRSVLSPAYWAYYGLAWFDGQTGTALGLAGLVAVIAALVKLRRPQGRRGWLVLVWLLGGMALFTVLGKKQPYYTLPLLPALALVTAREIAALRPRAVAVGIAVVLAGLGVHQWSALSFDRPLLPSSGALAYVAGRSPVPEEWMGQRFEMAVPWVDHGLHFDDVIDTIRAGGFESERDRVAVFADGTAFYESYLVSMTRLHLDTWAVEGVLIFPQAVTEFEPATDWFVYASRDEDSLWPGETEIVRTHEEFYSWEGNPELLQAVDRMGRRATRVETFPIDSGGIIHVYRLAGGGR